MGSPVAPNVVLDTNVIVSAVLCQGGKPDKIVEWVVGKKLNLFYSKEIILEYRTVLHRPKFGFDPHVLALLLESITHVGHIINPVPSTFPLTDESDRIFYDVAKASGSYLITGNSRHYPAEAFITTPADFIKLMSKQGFIGQ